MLVGQDGHYMVVTDRWQRFSDLALNEATLAMLAASADEFLVHGVDVEGMRYDSWQICYEIILQCDLASTDS
jgi:phosphoribosylformimino-5-aminoimidazole carboxamide ribonucleotide (ProFAR) isomerase